MTNLTEKVISGVLIGVAAGTILGLLLAPAKGSETRKKILKKGNEYAEGLDNTISEFIDTVNQKFDDMKAATEHAIKFAEEKAEEVMSADGSLNSLKSINLKPQDGKR